jgi:hypothetical protein
MALMTSRWTDDRLDNLKRQADELGHRMEWVRRAAQRNNARFNRLVIGLRATLTRFSLGLAGAVIVAVIAALLAS